MIVPVDLKEELLGRAEASAKAQGVSFREFVAAALENAVVNSRPTTPRRFVQRTHDFAAHLESPWTVLAEVEGEAYAPYASGSGK
jgi:hypothetical protein